MTLNDTDTRKELPVHIIIGARDYIKIKIQERARIGLPGQSVAELTKLSWVVNSPGQEYTVKNMVYSKTTVHDYENLCSLNVLGFEKNHKNRNSVVYEELQQQLWRSPEGCYETNLLWKDGHSHPSSNKSGSLGRFNNLSQNKQFETFDSIIRE